MKRVLLSIIMITIMFSLVGCGTKYQVYPSADTTKVKGIYYSLPRTIITVDLPVKLSIYTPGPYAKFAEELLGTQPDLNKSSKYSLGTPEVNVKSEADPNATFLVKVDGGRMEQRTMLMELTEMGILTQGQAKVEDKSVDFAVATVTTIANIAGKAITGAAGSTGPSSSEVAIKSVLGFGTIKADHTEALDQLRYMKSKSRYIILAADVNNALTQLDVHLSKKTKNSLNSIHDTPEDTDSNGKKQKFVRIEDVKSILAATEKLKDTNKPGAEAISKKFKAYKDPVILDTASSEYVTCNGQGLLTINKIKPPTANCKIMAALGSTRIKKLRDKIEKTDTVGNTKYLKTASVKNVYDELNRVIAIKVASDLKTIQEKKLNFLTFDGKSVGDVSKETIELLLTKLDEVMAPSVFKFAGSNTEATWTARFEFLLEDLSQATKDCLKIINPNTPGYSAECKQELPLVNLLEFSKVKGVKVLATNNFINKPNGKFAKSDIKGKKSNVNLSISVDMRKQMAGQIIGVNGNRPIGPQGFYYRIPSVAKVDIKNGTTRLVEPKSVTIAQWGAVSALPQSTGSWRSSSFDLSLYGDSGAIKKLLVTSEALSPEIIGTAGGAITTIMDAKKEKQAAELAKQEVEIEKMRLEADPLYQLTQKNLLLEAQDKNNTLNKAIEDFNNSDAEADTEADTE